MPFSRYTLVLLGLLLGACSREDETASSTYQPVVDVHQSMVWIIDPAADMIWDSAGTIITAEGQQELEPTTDEGWQKIVNSAAVLTEAGNLLMIPGRSAGQDWNEYAQGLIAAGSEAIEAARNQNADALFDAGGRIYSVCKACHDQYLVEVDDTDE